MAKQATLGVLELLQNVATTGDGTVIGIQPSIRNHVLYIRGNGAVGAGAIQLETASDPDYTGTWAALAGCPITVVATSELIVNLSGIFRFLRARISTDITVGTVTVSYVGYQ